MRDLISPVMVLIIGPILFIAFRSSDLHHLITHDQLRTGLFFIPLGLFFVGKIFEGFLNRFGRSAENGQPTLRRLKELIDIASRILLSLPLIYLFFFLWTGDGK